MNKKALLVAGLVAAVGVGWYLFRPERLWVDQTVNEALASASGSTKSAVEPAALAVGSFRGITHEGRGTATVFRYADGRRVLRFTEFEVSNGPDVHVYLVAAADAPDDKTVTTAGFVDLGTIKGNVGDQNYELPADVDLERYRSVTVWCKRFGVNFATAPLSAPSAS